MAQRCLDKNIVITPAEGRVEVHFAGRVIASSTSALALAEPGAPLRIYIPRADVDADSLAPSGHHSVCPYKGEASYHHLVSGDTRADNAVWYYPDPCPLVAPVQDHLAFWGDAIAYQTLPA
ncbi:DUF427 domain-containing protein [Arsenicitalea aurantiaca]|uniref:DUF427 domain-containing protein n=1 Tax=Arsenicitalea aurantiaca TaxID=1783274 RepID=A0A433XAT9_9HYPH|nr:DUF427 domain-containing protein [Arsenicitalea aurantiaca]RUT31207.1 DUF427 domain-containing protein [Arsenicitalea aurantiaca]